MQCARLGCKNEIPPQKTGRPRRFCSDACKDAEHKRRRREPDPATMRSALTHEAGEASLVDPAADPDMQVVAVVHETILLRNSYARLGKEARPELAVRCEDMADALSRGLLRNFRGAVDDG